MGCLVFARHHLLRRRVRVVQNHWLGVECGITIVHYSSVTDFSPEEHHSSLTELLAMMMQSPHPPVIPDCERYEHEIDYRLWDIVNSKSL